MANQPQTPIAKQLQEHFEFGGTVADAVRLVELLELRGSAAPKGRGSEADEWKAATLIVLTKMMLSLPSSQQNEAGAEASGEAFQAALDDVPTWAVAAAVRRWYRGDCGLNERGQRYVTTCPWKWMHQRMAASRLPGFGFALTDAAGRSWISKNEQRGCKVTAQLSQGKADFGFPYPEHAFRRLEG